MYSPLFAHLLLRIWIYGLIKIGTEKRLYITINLKTFAPKQILFVRRNLLTAVFSNFIGQFMVYVTK